MRYGSVCSGIEAATVAWEPLGWKPIWFSEIEPFPNTVLSYHYPSIPNLGDMTKIHENETFLKSKLDLLVGGTPCQSFSMAGHRAGLDDSRGNLAIEFLRVARTSKPKWIVWENVTGVLSSNKGRDFGTFIREIQKLRYGFVYRVLDATGFGIPQHRRRVYLVGYLGDWRVAAAVLFEPQMLCGSFAESDNTKIQPRRKIQKDVGLKDKAIGVDVYNYSVTGNIAATLGANCGSKNSHGPKVLDSFGIRIHTPIECERIQGFPDNYTNVPYKGKSGKQIDNLRYKAIGNSMAVPVMRWVGKRIERVNNDTSTTDIG